MNLERAVFPPSSLSATQRHWTSAMWANRSSTSRRFTDHFKHHSLVTCLDVFTALSTQKARSKSQSISCLSSFMIDDLIWFIIGPTDLTPSTQRPRGRCTGSAASFGCSQEPTEWHLSLHRTQVDESGMSNAVQSDMIAIATQSASQQQEQGSEADFLHNQVKGYVNVLCLLAFSSDLFFWFRIYEH